MPQDLSAALTVAADVLSAFRAHVALAALAGALALAALRRVRAALALFVAAGLCAAGLGPVWSLPGARAQGPEAPDAVEITLVSANLLRSNPQLDRARDALLALDPDILALIEVPRPLEPFAEAAFGDARLRHVVRSLHGPVGMAVLSARPYRRAPPILFDEPVPWHRALDIPVDDRGRVLRVLVFHNPAPFTRSHALRRKGLPQLRPLAADPTVVVGDFNAAPWNRTLSATAEATGTAVAGGWRSTWFPRLGGLGDLVRPWLGLPIDHLLTSPSVEVLSIRTVAIPGSDHRAQVARLRITWPSTPRPPSEKTP